MHERESFSECRVVVPVSPVRAVEFAYEANESAELCPTTRRFAEAAVAKLRDPDSAAMDPAGRPFAAWDGCSLLVRVLGADAETFRFKPDGLPDPFAGCHGSPPADSDRRGPRLAISYEAAPQSTGPTRRIAGRAVEVRQSSGSCTAIWDNGPSGGRNKWFATTVVELTLDDCDAVPGMVEGVVSLAGQRPQDSGTAPQRPLLYGPDDNDTATRGACVDFGNGADDDCEPYQAVDLPTGLEALLTAAEANRHVQCAVFSDAVEAGFGPAHTPVTWGAHCFFVDPKHELVITVNVSGGWGTAPGGYGRGDLYRERQVTEIAGLPAVTFWDSRGTAFDVYVSPHGSLSSPDNLHLGLESRPPRGSDALNAPLARAQADRAVRVMTRVVETFFT